MEILKEAMTEISYRSWFSRRRWRGDEICECRVGLGSLSLGSSVGIHVFVLPPWFVQIFAFVRLKDQCPLS